MHGCPQLSFRCGTDGAPGCAFGVNPFVWESQEQPSSGQKQQRNPNDRMLYVLYGTLVLNELKGLFPGIHPTVEFIGLICISKLASSREL